MRVNALWKQLVFLAILGTCAAGLIQVRDSLMLAAPPAQDSQEEASLEPFPIPEGDAAKLFEFMEELGEEEQQFTSAAEEREYQHRAMLTAIAVAERILKHEQTTDDEAEKAAHLKVQGFVNLAVLAAPDPKPAQRAVAEVQNLAKDERKSVAQFAKNNLTQVRIICVGGLPAKDRDELSEDVLKEVVSRKFAPRALRQAQMLGETLGEIGDQERVLSYYGKLAAAMRDSGIENLIGQATRIEGQLRRMKLPGNVMEVTGTTLDGEKFDWESYRGKVVLVDYWATWCGPCRQELPNVKKNYKKYHDQGFEVVGISLDEDPAQLQEFLKDQKIPWVTLFEPEESQRGWEHPLAVHYGISAIPMAILVDKEGKVVSLSARGPELTRLLDELLGEK